MDYKRFHIGRVQSLANVSGCCTISNQGYFKQGSQRSHITTKHMTVALDSLTFITLSSLTKMASYISSTILNIFGSFLLTFQQLLLYFWFSVASKCIHSGLPLWISLDVWALHLSINSCFPYRTFSFPALTKENQKTQKDPILWVNYKKQTCSLTLAIRRSQEPSGAKVICCRTPQRIHTNSKSLHYTRIPQNVLHKSRRLTT